MNRTEQAVGEGIGLVVGWAIRVAFELLVFVVVPLLAAAAFALALLHQFLTSWLIEALDLPDSALIRILAGTALFPVIIAAAGAALAACGLAAYFVVTADIHVPLKVLLTLMSVGALLSLLAIIREHIAGGVDGELDLDFAALWDDG